MGRETITAREYACWLRACELMAVFDEQGIDFCTDHDEVPDHSR